MWGGMAPGKWEDRVRIFEREDGRVRGLECARVEEQCY